jgi:hypothetical protein
LADQLGVELGTVQREVNVKVDTVEGALRCVHALEVLLEVLATEVGGEGDDFLDAYRQGNVALDMFLKAGVGRTKSDEM